MGAPCRSLGVTTQVMSLQTKEMTKTMWEKHCSHSLLLQLLHGKSLLYDAHFYQVLENNSLGQKMHISPLNTLLHILKHLSLSIPNSLINSSLLFRILPIDWEGYCLVGTVAIPPTTHVIKDQLSRLNHFIIVDVVEGGTVSTTRANRIEC